MSNLNTKKSKSYRRPKPDAMAISFRSLKPSNLYAESFILSRIFQILPASKKTSDGRNAHFLIAPADWWTQKIKEHFKIITCIEVGELESGEAYPIHLIGCATNSMNNFRAMNEFISKIKCANKRWVWKKGGARFMDYT